MKGWALVSTGVAAEFLQELRNSIFAAGSAGKRCLLDEEVHAPDHRIDSP